MSGARHKKIFGAWFSRLPIKTKWLVNAVVEKIVPHLEARGFVWVDSPWGKDAVEQNHCIPLVRAGIGYIDVVYIVFLPNKRPLFTISFRRWKDEEIANKERWFPHYLTKFKGDHYYKKLFGFGWYDIFVTESRCTRLVNRMLKLLLQMDDCLERGIAGLNVTESYYMYTSNHPDN